MVSDFERARLENIKRNNNFLASLGMCPEAKQKPADGDRRAARAAAKSFRKPNKRIDDSACRRSSRFKVDATLSDNDFVSLDNEKGSTEVCVRKALRRLDDDTELEKLYQTHYDSFSSNIPSRGKITKQSLKDYVSAKPDDGLTVGDDAIAHCVMRIHSMSEKALANRIKMIARAAGKSSREKLLVTYYAMELMGLVDLAKLCQSALREEE